MKYAEIYFRILANSRQIFHLRETFTKVDFNVIPKISIKILYRLLSFMKDNAQDDVWYFAIKLCEL